MIDIQKLVRPNIAILKPYSSARDEFKGKADVFLDANENSLGSPISGNFNRYPDPQQTILKQQIAALKNIATEKIFLGNGSDEAIDLLFRVFCEPGKDNILLLLPTYGMYAVQANIHGTAIKTANLTTDFQPDEHEVFSNINASTKLIFVCSPNNPTGNTMPKSFIFNLLEKFSGIVVVDEAYIDFSENASLLEHLDKFPNLVVLQTLSKAWGLAGLRIGMAFANPSIIQLLNKVKYPYNLSLPATRLAEKALKNEKVFQKKLKILKNERERLADALKNLDFVEKVFPSDANFLLVRVRDADGLYDFLAKNGIVVRDRSREIHCENCLRITVGSPSEVDILIKFLKEFQ